MCVNCGCPSCLQQRFPIGNAEAVYNFADFDDEATLTTNCPTTKARTVADFLREARTITRNTRNDAEIIKAMKPPRIDFKAEAAQRLAESHKHYNVTANQRPNSTPKTHEETAKERTIRMMTPPKIDFKADSKLSRIA